MTALKRRKVGKTKLEVTEIGLGGAPMGGFRATISDAEAVQLTDAGYDAGIRYFDTSPFYGYGRSELRMGAALREKPRDSYVLSTKIGRILHVRKPGEELPKDFRENGLPGFVPQFDYTYDGVMRSLEHSHLRLGLDKHRHRAGPRRRFLDHQGPRHPRRALQDGDGLRLPARSTSCARPASSRAIGVGINEGDTSMRFIKAGDFDCMLLAGRYTLLEQGALEEFLPECTKRNVSVILGGPYNSGILTGNVKTGATHDYVAAPAASRSRRRRRSRRCASGTACRSAPRRCSSRCSIPPSARSSPARSASPR